MNRIASIQCNEPVPEWFRRDGLAPKALPQGSIEAALWLTEHYPNRAQIVPCFLGTQPQTIALSVGALLSGHNLLFVPAGHDLPPWLGEQVPLGTALREAQHMQRQGGEVLSKPSQFGSWLIWGSGSSGGQKVIKLGYQQLAYAAHSQSRHLGLTQNDRWLCCLPLDHIGGLMSVLRVAWVGGSISLHQRFCVEDIATDLHHCQGISFVPTMAWRLCQTDPTRYTHQPIALIGGASATTDLIQRLQARGIRPLRCYGATETSAMISCQSLAEQGEPHCGALIGCNEARLNKAGVLQLKGPQIAKEALSPTGHTLDDNEGWLTTGDSAAFTDNDRLRILGRSDGAIHSGGLTIFPEKIEEIVEANPLGIPCAIIPITDHEWGQCLVLLAANQEQTPLDELQAWCHEVLAPEQRPKRYLSLVELPILRSGKIDRRQLTSLVKDYLEGTIPKSPDGDKQKLW